MTYLLIDSKKRVLLFKLKCGGCFNEIITIYITIILFMSLTIILFINKYSLVIDQFDIISEESKECRKRTAVVPFGLLSELSFLIHYLSKNIHL